MKARVIALRRRGRRIRDGGGEGILGELQLHSILIGSVMHRVANLNARDEGGSREQPLLDPLFEPELVALGAESMLIRGYESAEGTGYVQEWHCRILAA
jgi:hypothetical protein